MSNPALYSPADRPERVSFEKLHAAFFALAPGARIGPDPDDAGTLRPVTDVGAFASLLAGEAVAVLSTGRAVETTIRRDGDTFRADILILQIGEMSPKGAISLASVLTKRAEDAATAVALLGGRSFPREYLAATSVTGAA